MFFIIGFVALGIWLLLWLGQTTGVLELGQARNVLLLVGLACVFLGVLKSRDAAQRRDFRK